jgi:hypothetical protein
VVDPPTCSAISQLLGEPLAGTAPHARAWVALEQPGPWGRSAATESHLDPALGAELERRIAGTGVRLALIRRPGRHPDLRSAKPRQVLISGTGAGASAGGTSWLERGSVASAAELLDLDFAAIGAGHAPGVGARVDQPVALVCTNARRDRCCAVLGRPLATALAATHPGRVWECTHLGGHRFAPTAVVLPHGLVYGRLSLPTGVAVLAAAQRDEVVLDHLRGRSCWHPAGQAAEVAVRTRIGETGIARVWVATVDAVEQATGVVWEVTVTAHDGRSWQAEVSEQRVALARPESCGKDPSRPVGYLVRSLS